jgi:hypothetical protein
LYLNIGPAEYTHLAVTADHLLYRAMTRAEFNTCRCLGEFYLCDRGLVVTKAPRIDATPPQWKESALCLFALFARRFELAAATCMTTIGGKDAAMRMVAPDAFGSYTARPHRNGHVQGREHPGGSGVESINDKRPHKDHRTTRMHVRDEHAHLCSSQRRVQMVRQ